jgi:hypothetical protein
VTPNRDIREMLRRTYTYSVVTAWLALSMIWPASAKIFWMTEPDLRASFSGASIKGEYTNDRSFAERYQATGELAYTEIARKRHMIGRWSIVRNRFCTIYDSSGTGGCFRVHQISINCFEFYFDTRTEEEARKSTLRNPTWTARAWRPDRPTTCQDRPMV